MTEARIFQPAKTAMQSGRSNTKKWVLEFEPTEARRADSLMGWIGSGDTRAQVRLRFSSKEDAIAYADNHNLSYQVQTPQRRRVQSKNYSENYSFRFRFE
jgi:hypothetical protein